MVRNTPPTCDSCKIEQDVRQEFLVPDWVWFIGIFVAYIILTRWLLPKMGIPT